MSIGRHAPVVKSKMSHPIVAPPRATYRYLESCAVKEVWYGKSNSIPVLLFGWVRIEYGVARVTGAVVVPKVRVLEVLLVIATLIA
jgi:nitrate reductase beta subunit